jgi:hypothetical protein
MKKQLLSIILLLLSVNVFTDNNLPPQISSDSNLSTFVFYRPSKIAGSAVAFKIIINQKEITTLKVGEYKVIRGIPDEYLIYVSYGLWSKINVRRDVVRIISDPGNIYFLKLDPHFFGGDMIDIIPQEEAATDIEDMKYISTHAIK